MENAPGALDLPFAALVPCVGMLGLGLDYFVLFKTSDYSFAPVLHGVVGPW